VSLDVFIALETVVFSCVEALEESVEVAGIERSDELERLPPRPELVELKQPDIERAIAAAIIMLIIFFMV